MVPLVWGLGLYLGSCFLSGTMTCWFGVHPASSMALCDPAGSVALYDLAGSLALCDLAGSLALCDLARSLD